MRRSRPRYPHWRSNRPPYQYQQQYPSQQYRHPPPQQLQNPQQSTQSNDVFDFLNLPDSFPIVKQSLDDPNLTPIILERNQQLMPSATDSAALLNFVTRIKNKLEALVLAPNSFTACQIAEVRDLGSHVDTITIGSSSLSASGLTSGVVVVLKTLPTREAIEQLGHRLKNDLSSDMQQNEEQELTIESTDYGLCLETGPLSVHLLVTTQANHLNSLDPSIHLDPSICKRNFNAIKQAKWIDEICSHPSKKLLVRLLKDLRQRFPGLETLNPWLINLLAHHCVTNHQSNETLPPSYAFKRALQLLSSGLFLPGSNGLYDPLADGSMNGQQLSSQMTLEEQDRLCYTSQTLLRALAIHPRYVLGLEEGPDIFSGPCELNGFQFIPSEPVFSKNEFNGETIDENQQQTAAATIDETNA